ncbi:hypothetical protein E2C01_097174 [Portunus trituberculatus]|uniref:Uncharacterized protein n=1 Tax=Portunus trituberculatus TaxID=210409 RepID=A0A5B7K8W2_PORTR|nr:hypothetical protein [Portunus trituberculatus]
MAVLCERPPELLTPPNVIITRNKNNNNSLNNNGHSMRVRLVEVSMSVTATYPLVRHTDLFYSRRPPNTKVILPVALWRLPIEGTSWRVTVITSQATRVSCMPRTPSMLAVECGHVHVEAWWSINSSS